MSDESLLIQNPKNGVKRHLKISYKSKKDARNDVESMIADGPISTESGSVVFPKANSMFSQLWRHPEAAGDPVAFFFKNFPRWKQILLGSTYTPLEILAISPEVWILTF